MDIRAILQREFSLPYMPGTSGGLEAICLGAFPLLQNNPDFQVQIARELDPRKLHQLPNRTIDPIGYLFAQRAVASREKLMKDLAKASSSFQRNELLAAAPWSAFHLKLFRESLRLISATCRKNQIDGINDFNDDTTLALRLKQQAVHLYIAPDPSASLFKLSEPILLKEAEDRLKWLTPGFKKNQNCQEPEIDRRSRKSPSLSDQVSVSMKLQLPFKTRLYLSNAARQEEFDDELARENAELESAAIDQSLGARQKALRLPFLSLSALPMRGGLTESGLSIMRSWVRSNWQTDPSALLLALVDIAYLADEAFSGARVERHGVASYLVTNCPYLTATATSPELHLSVAEEFWRPIPPELATATQDLLNRHDREKLLLDRDILLRDRFCTSYAKLKAALRYNAPIWDDVSWLGSEFGLNPVRFDERGKSKMPGFRSYSVWDPSVHEYRSIASLSRRGWDLQADPEIEKTPRCGSRNCPNPAVISEMVKVLDLLIEHAKKQMPSQYLEAACLMNSISAQTRLLELLLIFARNYPGEAPLVVRSFGRYELLSCVQLRKEKIRSRPLVYGSELRALLETVADVFQSFISNFKKKGFKFKWMGEQEGGMQWRSYAFLPRHPAGNKVVLQHPRKSLIADGLLHHPETEHLGQLALNGMRNLDYYLLTANPEFDRVVMDLCDHLPTGGKGSTGRGSAASLSAREIRQKAATALLHNISWPWQ